MNAYWNILGLIALGALVALLVAFVLYVIGAAITSVVQSFRRKP